MTPEEKARVKIDRMFEEAGWQVVSRDEYTPNLTAAAIKEGLLKHNLEADYFLFINGKAVGVLEAKRAEIDVDAWGMFQNILLVTLLPVTLGVAFNYFLGKREDFKLIQGIMPGISVLCLACIVGGVIFTVHPQLQANGLKLIALTLAVVTLHNGTGYLLGYFVGEAFGFNTAKRRTLSIEVGMQNAGMATVLARNFFASPAMIATNPMAALAVIPCAISCAYHSISGTLLAGFFTWQDDRRQA